MKGGSHPSSRPSGSVGILRRSRNWRETKDVLSCEAARISGGAVMTARAERLASIRSLNDQMRANGVGDIAAQWVVTSGVQSLGPAAMAEVLRLVRTFSAFDEGNDPHGEHDFGSDLSRREEVRAIPRFGHR